MTDFVEVVCGYCNGEGIAGVDFDFVCPFCEGVGHIRVPKEKAEVWKKRGWAEKE
jgi:DnaJ-class molecular chaperone